MFSTLRKRSTVGVAPGEMAPRFQFVKRHRSAADDVILERRTSEKRGQYTAAVRYCIDNNCKGYAALKTGQFGLIKDPRTINRRLEKTIVTGEEKGHLKILTSNEEECLVRYLVNRNRACRGLSRAETEKLILDMLKVKDHINKTSRKDFVKLTDNAKKALIKNRIGRGFWRRFDIAHPDVKRKKPGNVSINRALSCTRDMAAIHLDELATELIEVGIFTNAERIDAGVWTGDIDTSRIIAHDETPQFINYGPDKRAKLVYCGTGEECHKLTKENRECVTIQPFSTFSGEMILVQVIFAGKGVSSHMCPQVAVDSIKNLMISTTEYGVSTHESLLDAYKVIETQLTQANIQHPVVIISDGHSSRTDADTLKFLLDNLMRLFLLPSNTTGVTQKHDQINQNIHKEYQNAKEEIFTPFSTINHEGFMTVLSKAWPRWIEKEDLVAAGKRVGISKDGLNVNWMDQKKFDRAEIILGSKSETAPHPSDKRNKIQVASPPDVRKGSKKYLQLKLQEAERMLNERLLDVTEVPGLMSIPAVKPKVPSSKNVKITHMYGSMTANDALSAATQIKEARIEKEKKKVERMDQKKMRIEAFYRCKQKCQCDSTPCDAFRLKECSLCNNILLTQCSRCKSPGGSKPEMILTASARDHISRKRNGRQKREILEPVSSGEEDEEDHSEDWDAYVSNHTPVLEEDHGDKDLDTIAIETSDLEPSTSKNRQPKRKLLCESIFSDEEGKEDEGAFGDTSNRSRRSKRKSKKLLTEYLLSDEESEEDSDDQGWDAFVAAQTTALNKYNTWATNKNGDESDD